MQKSGLRNRRRFGIGAGLVAAAGIGAALFSGTEQPTATPRPAIKAASPWIASGVSTKPSRVDYRRLNERIVQLMRQPDMVGLAVGMVENGQVRFVQGYGETLAGSGIPVTPTTVFRWASVSKGVASTLVAKLAEDGKLSLDTPLSKIGTTLTLPGDSARVTVADVLSHRVGLVHNAWDDRLEAGEDPRQLRRTLGTLPVFCPPASCYAYQNIAYDTASEIVEHVTRHPYADVVRERLFAPLGMRHASIGMAGLLGADSWAHPHHMARTPAQVNDVYYRIPAAGGVNSSITDLVSWMRAQMGAAPGILSPNVLEEIHHPRVATPPRGRRAAMDRALTNAEYGLGWRTYTYAGHHLVGHRGSVDGYGSLILFDPEQKSGITMLWNSNRHIAARLQLEFFDMLYGLPPTDWLDLPPVPIAAPGAPPAASRR